jgi:hypothetical protein
MDRIRRTRSAHHITDTRASDPDLRSAAEDRTVSYVLRRLGDWRAESARGEGAVGQDEYPGLHAGEDVAAYGSDGRVRGRQSADAGAG